jgi:hypothetical protein
VVEAVGVCALANMIARLDFLTRLE